jgi:DNA helicase-2/ATP-dependent DNA helicase PcrA
VLPDEERPGGPRSRSRAVAEPVGEHDPELFEALRTWRQQVATETDKPAFTVLVDEALRAVAATRPTTVAELARVRGIGPAKIDRYGAALLAIVAGRRP